MIEKAISDKMAQALADLCFWLNSQHIPYTLIGGVAISLVAQPRATQDIDALIWLEEEKWRDMINKSAAFNFKGRIADVEEFARTTRVLLMRHVTSGISIDLSCGALSFELQAIERSRKVEIAQIVLNVSSPEDLIIMKAVARRARDIADIESIISTHPDLDNDYIFYWAKEFAAALDQPDIFTQLKKLLSS